MKILVTGGTGFIGSNIAIAVKQRWPAAEVVAFDNLRRRGSELNVQRLRNAGIVFAHGDIRIEADLDLDGFAPDWIVECSAEPSVRAGYNSSASYAVNTNLTGCANCLELARRYGAAFLFFSTSRVYPVNALRSLPLHETQTRFDLPTSTQVPGLRDGGITEDFPLTGYRTLYGATKLAAELLIEEYRTMFGVRAIVNRCSTIAGPWQMGKVDQGVFSLWMAVHLLGKSLVYMGFGGEGKQVRDCLHVDDLADLVIVEMENIASLDGSVFNVGGGLGRSLSLQECTELCRKISGKEVSIGSIPETHPSDVPYYVSNCMRVEAATGWQPRRTPETVLQDLRDWMYTHQDVLANLLGG